MKTITIELPEVVTVTGMSDAPEQLRQVATEKWDADFCLTALRHGVSQKLGDTWSVTKKNEEKLAKVHQNLAAGEWTTKERTGASAVKFDEAIKKLNAEALYGKLDKATLLALAAMVKPD